MFASLERLSHLLTALHGRAGAQQGLTSLQVFLLLELASNREMGVRELAARFSLSRPTVSRSLAILAKRKLVETHPHSQDGRRVVFSLSSGGRQVVASVARLLQPAVESLERLPRKQQQALWTGLMALLAHWEKEGLMASFRMCPTCRFFRGEMGDARAFCELLGRPLTFDQFRLDCPEYEERR